MPCRERCASRARDPAAVEAVAAAAPQASENPAEIVVLRSKCLPQSDEQLRVLDSRRRIQVVSYVNAHRTDRRRVAKADSERVRVLPIQAQSAEDVATVIKGCDAQSFFDRHRNAELRVHDQQLTSTNRDRDGEARIAAARGD